MSWIDVTIDDITEVVTKGTTPTTYGMPFTEEGVNFIKAEALNGDVSLDRNGFTYISEDTHEKLKRSQLHKDDVLITIAGANVGKCGFVKEGDLPANTNQAVGIIRVRAEKAWPRFVYYHFKNPATFAISQNMSGQAAQPNINLTVLKRFKLRLPDYDVQKEIADRLTAYDDLLENNRRRIQLLEESARLLYKEWFVQMRFPSHEHVKIINGVPEGWSRKSIDQVAETIGGGTPSTRVNEYWEGGDNVWFSPTDLTRNNCIALLDSAKKITDLGMSKSSAKHLPPRTILMTSRASIGYFGIYEGVASTNQGFISMVPNREIYRWYILHNLKGRVDEIVGLAGGATFKEINKTTFRAMELLIPNDSLLEQFSDFYTAVYQQVLLLKKQTQKLEEARDILLPRLMNGELAA